LEERADKEKRRILPHKTARLGSESRHLDHKTKG